MRRPYPYPVREGGLGCLIDLGPDRGRLGDHRFTDMDITNKSRKPISVPLPGGKKLFLGPGKTGQVTAKALEYPPLAKLIETGKLATADGVVKRVEGGSDSKVGPSGGPRPGGTGARRQSGDR